MAKTYKIAVVPGDGTGPEVVAEAVKVLKATADKFKFKVDLTNFDFGGERYKRTGETLPDSAVEELRKFDAILLGAIGHPDVAPGILEKGILLKMRFELDQYINLRPVRLYPGVETPLKNKGPEDIDFVVIRENSGDAYTGAGGITMKGTPNEVAVQSAVYSRFQVDRCLKYAFEYAQKHGKKARAGATRNTLALCGKTNVLTYIYGLWERAFHEMGQAQYPDIRPRVLPRGRHGRCGSVKNPEWFDVIVTGNLFGDIITDLGAMIQGGMGNRGRRQHQPRRGGVSMFEPIGGSAPKYTGKNVITRWRRSARRE
jgi:3-isopropylmalate dehydrogenase